MQRVLNVGGGPSRELPPHFEGWKQDLLDIDKKVKPDICCDARKMSSLRPSRYDAVYCSHNLEHFYEHDVPTVLGGFRHVLKRGGFAEIAVPNIMNLIASMSSGSKDIDDIWYVSPGGPIRFHDVMYGWGAAMRNGNIYYAHKCAFSPTKLRHTLIAAGFEKIEVQDQGANILATAVK